MLAIDALKAHRRTKVKRGGQKLLEGLKRVDAAGQTQSPDVASEASRLQDHAIPAESGQVQSPDGYVLDSIDALEDWADRLTTQRARIGFSFLAIGFAIDLFSKAACNPLLFSK